MSNVAKARLFVAVFLVSIVLIAYVILSKGWHMGVACLDVDKLLMSEAPIMVYGSAAYVGMVPKKFGGHIKVHKLHALNVCSRLAKGLHGV